MSMTREDMLRELELLPVWVLNPNAVLPVPAELAAEKSIEPSVNPSVIQTVEASTPEPQAATASVAIAEVQNPPLQAPPLPESALMRVPESMSNEVSPQHEAMHAATKTPIAWMLVCPADAAPNETSQALLKNMIKAMQLLQTEVVVVQQAPDLTTYQAQKVVCFGLDAFNQYLAATQPTEAQHTNTQVQDSALENLRGKPHMHQATACWVTYSPTQLLANPALKRGAWQDLCAAMAHVG